MKLCPKCQKHFSDDANFCPVDAARLIPLEAQASGPDSLSARFELGAKVGGGRTGAVHRATDKTTGTACIVKLIAPAVVALPGVAQRLERELRQLERVSSAGVVKVIGSGKRGDTSWVAMELVDGAHTLAEAISARGPIPATEAAELVEVIGEALIEAAQVGVVHRDLAPKNVLFAGGDVKLINFSLPVPTSEKVPGVPEFVAPEQHDGKPVDQRSNLYSVGALYYYVLTGQAPSHDQVKPPSQLVSSIAAGSPIENVIMRALDRSPTKRFLTVRQLIDEVGRVAKSEVIELNKPVQPAAKRPKAELVSTLMGVSKGGAALGLAVKPAGPSAPTIASAPTVGTGVPSVAASAPAAVSASPHQASIMQTVIGMPPQSPNPSPPHPAQESRSPWAAPGAAPAVASSPAAATIVPVAAPAVAAPAAPIVPAAPVVAAPLVAKKNADAPKEDRNEKKGKFRETMWFKKGDLGTQAAIAAAEERARTGKDVAADKADSLPMDERYKDDGSISARDKEKYSLRTGGTQMMQAMRDGGPAAAPNVSEDELIGEMKGGRKAVMIAIVIGLAAIVAIVVMLAT
jgi:eukaryotic-like serine/threonine-protein kinase